MAAGADTGWTSQHTSSGQNPPTAFPPPLPAVIFSSAEEELRAGKHGVFPVRHWAVKHQTVISRWTSVSSPESPMGI